MDEPATATLTAPGELVLAPPRPRSGLVRRVGTGAWRSLVTDVRAEANARAEAAATTTDRAVLDRNAAAVLVTVAVCLTITQFLATGSQPGWLATLLRGVGLDGVAAWLEGALLRSPGAQLHRLAFWATVQITGYVALPLLVTRFVLRVPLSEIGVQIRGTATHARAYLVLFAVALPFVVAASYTAAFQAKYPFYDLAAGEGLWPRLWIWWGLYALQFAALELFFRGFVLHGLVPRLGYAAVFVMIVPYNMIHYTKPMPEALAAIAGGLVLGSLSLKTRSIWWGAALHCSIAGVMDALALWHAGVLF